MIHAIVAPIKAAIADLALFDPVNTDTRLAGIVIPVSRTDKEGRRVVFPASCDVDGEACYEQGRYFELLPNDRYRAVVYFEQLSDVRFTGYKPLGGKDRIFVFDTSVRLVGWLNLKKFGSTDCSITARLVLGIIKALTATPGETSREAGRFAVTDEAYTNAAVEALVVRQVRQDASIFNRYTFTRSTDKTRTGGVWQFQDILYPWDYFALDIACTLEVGRECFDEVTAGEEILC